MAVKLHRCSNQWVKVGGPSVLEGREGPAGAWGSSTSASRGRSAASKREAVFSGTGQRLYPAIQFEDGSWYREESKEMERTIRAGELMSKAAAPASRRVAAALQLSAAGL